jgi:hypothetical protein
MSTAELIPLLANLELEIAETTCAVPFGSTDKTAPLTPFSSSVA